MNIKELNHFLLFLVLFPVLTRPQTFRFATIGDWGTAHEKKNTMQVDTANAMASVLNNLPVEFVVSVGDNFYEDGARGYNDTLFRVDWENVYNSTSLLKPWYVTLGNHDVLTPISILAELAYHQTNPRWIMPSEYYYEVFPVDPMTNMTIFFLNSNTFQTPEDDPVQWDWLVTQMKQVRTHWLVVACHHPVYTCGTVDGEPNITALWSSKMSTVLEQANAQVFVSGHDHTQQYLTKNGVNYFISGSGGQLSSIHKNCPVEELFVTGFARNGFQVNEVNATHMTVSIYDSTATRLYETVIVRNGLLQGLPANFSFSDPATVQPSSPSSPPSPSSPSTPSTPSTPSSPSSPSAPSSSSPPSSPSSPPLPSPPSSSGGGLSKGQIAGIVVGCLVVGVVALVVIAVLVKRRMTTEVV